MLTLVTSLLLLQHTVTMVSLPAGRYQPLYGRPGDAPIEVNAFRMDRDPVTRQEFSDFVRKYPEWRRSSVRALFADRLNYLSDWESDLVPGADEQSTRAVTGVSWFAARAYCAARSSRLPTVAEWEYAAAASKTARYAARQPQFIQYLVSLYTTRSSVQQMQNADENVFGLRGMHGIVWEWVEDFNSVLISDDSRSIDQRDHNLFCASAAIGAVNPNNFPAFLRFALRAGLTGRTTIGNLGFRCAA